MKGILRPIAYAARSALGVNGLSERLASIDRSIQGLRSTAVSKMSPAENTGSTPSIANADYATLFGNPPLAAEPPTAIRLGSRLCRQGDLATDGFRYWMSRMRQAPSLNRKIWEWYFITDALFQRGQLQPGRRGLGFGVGQEPLSSLFAALGAHIVATDMGEEGAIAAGWSDTGQHAASLTALNARGICDPELFKERVSFRVVDMNHIPADFNDGFDFCWSSCSLEHIGSLEHGLRFVERSMDVLKPGGVAVHTTEFNMTSNDRTFESPGLSLYRRRDIEAVLERLTRAGHQPEPINWDEGAGFADGYVDLPPYFSTPVHLRLQIADYACTSIGLIVRKT